jgi:enoyl-CoA hydratase
MSPVLFEIRHNVALITLNNPAKRNMLTQEVCDLIVDAVAAAEAHPDVKALIVTGNGKAFCAGGQLADLTPNQAVLEKIYSGFLSIANCTLPTIAAINGPAVGAGFNMAVGCDVRIVTALRASSRAFLAWACTPAAVIRGCCASWSTGIRRRVCCFSLSH